MSLLSVEEHRHIGKTIQEVEKTTGGEIVVAIIQESDDYMAREIMFGIICGLIAYVLIAVFSTPFIRILEIGFWTDSPLLLPVFMIMGAMLVGALAYALAQIPAIDRLVVGKKLMIEAVRRRAMRYFVESKVYDTVDRTGILLLVSVLERRVELMADRGINEKVDPQSWERIVSLMVEGIRNNHTASAIETAVKSIGAILSEYVPPRDNDVNELADGPVELQKGT